MLGFRRCQGLASTGRRGRGVGASVPTPPAQLRKETGVLIRSRLQVPPSVSLQAVSWFLDGSDLEIQAREMLSRRHCQVPEAAPPSASAALCIYLLTMVPDQELFTLTVFPGLLF